MSILRFGPLVIAVGFSSLARAEEAKVVVFPVVGIGEEAKPEHTEAMTKALLEEISLNRALVAIAGPAWASTGGPADRQPTKSSKAARRALGQLKDGHRQFQRLRFPQAIKAYANGIAGLSKNLEFIEDYDGFLQAHIDLAVAYLRRGQQTPGRDILGQALRLKPDLKIDESKYPPLFVNMVEEQRTRILASPQGAVEVTADNEGAKVALNGTAMGDAPVRIENIPVGEHHLVVRSGAESWSRTIVVKSQQTESEAVHFGGGKSSTSGVLAAMKANRFDREVRAEARAQAQKLGGDFALVAVMGSGRGVYAVGAFIERLKTGRWDALEPAAPDFDMLSVGIEGNSMATDIARRVAKFRGEADPGVVPFIPGKKVVRAANAKGRMRTVPFLAGGGAMARAPIGGRAPIGSSRSPIARRGESHAPSPIVASASRSGTKDTSRVPVVRGTRSRLVPRPEPKAVVPIVPKPEPEPKAEPTVEPTPEPKVEPTPEPKKNTPVLALATPRRGPVISGQNDKIEGSDEPPLEALVATSPTAIQPTVDLTAAPPPDSDGSDSVVTKWWFWTAIGVGVAAIAGGTAAALATRGGPADSVKVFAVW